jgi:hypothetical protein
MRQQHDSIRRETWSASTGTSGANGPLKRHSGASFESEPLPVFRLLTTIPH